MTTSNTELQATIAELRTNVADRDGIIAALEQRIDELTKELYCRDIDELTGLYNLRWLREWWAGLRRPSDTVGAVVFVDVDLLKRINDTYGHKVGDRVISHVASVLISSGCYGVRYGGDEFLLLVPAGWDTAATLDRIVTSITSSSIPARGESITVAVSCGARIVDDQMDLWQMIHDADTAMYEVKRERSGVTGYRIVR